MKPMFLVSLLLLSSGLPASAQFNVRNGLAPTTTDSFVYQAGGSMDAIYGDEGTVQIPPYNSFTPDHRINAGIFGVRNSGLTTGHGSYMPDAWGGDEWTGNEWSMSGTNSLGGSGAGSAAADAAAYAANQADSTLQNYTGPSGAEMAAAESALNTVDPNAAAPTNPVNGNLLGIYNPVTAAADAALLGSGALRNTTPVETMPVNTILDGSALTAATEAAGNATGAASGATGATGSTSATGF